MYSKRLRRRSGDLPGELDGAGLAKGDPRLVFRRVMFAMARKQAGQVQHHPQRPNLQESAA